jgi:hypothetical protein
VHGTFGRNAPWTRPGSFIRNELTRAFGDAVDFEVFEWSGRNSHAARYAAGVELRRFLDSVATRFPRSDRIVIAHSHGGNVALHALGLYRSQRGMHGLVTVGTPFIEAVERDHQARVTTLLIAALGVPILFAWQAFLNAMGGPGFVPAWSLVSICASRAGASVPGRARNVPVPLRSHFGREKVATFPSRSDYLPSAFLEFRDG